MRSGEVFEALLLHCSYFPFSYKSVVMWVFYTQIMMSLLVYFDDEVTA